MQKLVTKPKIIYTALLMLFSTQVHATDDDDIPEQYTTVLPTVVVEGQRDTGKLKGYINYDEASGSRNGLTTKEQAQAIDIINIQKNKNYNTNDLSSILEGNAGIDATYDMRGESIYIRGFKADENDIYRDGVRESGQIRRSTANIERVEILKGPSSVLYGRSNGGGVINMVSKYALFKKSRNVGMLYSSYGTRNANMDINQKLNEQVAIRLVGEVGRGHTFRSGSENENVMFSPSISVRGDKFYWTGQYLYDTAERVPDRNPSKAEYDKMGIDYRQGFAHPNDFVKDKLQSWRSHLEYRFTPNVNLQWQLAHRKAEQNFDHFYAGTYNTTTKKLVQNYAWQQTDNETLSNTLTLNADFNIGKFHNHLTVGYDYSKERRNPILGFNSRALMGARTIDPFADASTWIPSGRLLDATTNNRHRAETHGLFIQNIFSATPNVKLSMGGRYEQYRFQSTDIKNQSNQYKGNHFSPNLGAVWDINPNHTVYASYSKSFSPYGGNGLLGVDTTVNSATFNDKPEVNRQYELGLKSTWLNGKLSSTLSLYQMERLNKRYRPDAQNDPFTWVTRGKERSRGVELGVLGQIAPKWYVRGSLGVMSAKILEDKQNPVLSGRYLSNTAKMQGNVFVRYTPTENWYGEIGVTGGSKRHLYAGRLGDGEYQPLAGFARVDMMAGYNHKNWNATFAVNNLLNQQYWRSDSMLGSPRTYTMRLNYQF